MRHRRPLLLATAAVLLLPPAAGAVGNGAFWRTATDGAFADGQRWANTGFIDDPATPGVFEDGVAPGGADRAVFNLAGPYRVTLPDVFVPLEGIDVQGGANPTIVGTPGVTFLNVSETLAIYDTSRLTLEHGVTFATRTYVMGGLAVTQGATLSAGLLANVGGPGSVAVNTGATLSGYNAQFSDGTTTVDGAGSTFSYSLLKLSAKTGGAPALTVANGAAARIQSLTMESGAATNPAITVSGAGSSLVVGSPGSSYTINLAGSITASDGGAVYLGNSPGATPPLVPNTVVLGGGTAVTGGVTVHGNLVNHAYAFTPTDLATNTIHPWVVHGDYTQGADGHLDFALLGTDPGRRGRLTVDGTLHAGGQFYLTLGMSPSETTSFKVLDFASIVGTFDDVGLYGSLPELITFDPSDLYTTGTVRFLEPEHHVWTATTGTFAVASNWQASRPSAADLAYFDSPAAGTPFAVTFDSDASTHDLAVITADVDFDLGGHTYAVAEYALIGRHNADVARLTVRNGSLTADKLYIGDTTYNYEGDAAVTVGAGGTVTANVVRIGSRGLLTVAGGAVHVADYLSASDGSVKVTAGSLAASELSVGGDLTVSGGSIATDALTVYGKATLGGGTVTAGTLYAAVLDVQPGGKLVLESGTAGALPSVTVLITVAPGAVLDLTRGGLATRPDEAAYYGIPGPVPTGPEGLAALSARVAQAYHDGAWDGAGITSSTAAADAHGATAVGIGLAGFLGLDDFLGEYVYADSVLLRYTWYGDANLDGLVNQADLALMRAGSAMASATWQNGDFNYDGRVTADDYILFQLGAAVSGGGNIAPPRVPEPAGVMGLLAAIPLRRRRRAM